MANKIRLKNYKMKWIIVAVVAIIFMVYIILHIYSWYRNGTKTETVVKDAINDSIKTTALIIRDETVVYGKDKGILMNCVEDGERVSKGGVISQIYKDEQQVADKLEMKQIEREIEALKKLNVSSEAVSRGPEYIDKQINDELRENFIKINNCIYADIKKHKENVLNLINERQAVLGKVDNFFGRISQLQERKNELLKNDIENVGTINSDYAGYFVSRTDGYEEYINYNNINNLTLDDLNFEKYQSKNYNNSIGKIIKSVDWYVACKITASDAMKISKGDIMQIEIPSAITDAIPCKVVSINQKSKDEEALLILSCNRMDKMLSTIRNEDVEIIINKYSGLKVNINALREKTLSKKIEEDGKEKTIEKKVRGVYVKYGNNVMFKEVYTLYTGSQYIICDDSVDKSLLFSEDTLQVGDEVIIEGMDLYDGKYVR